MGLEQHKLLWGPSDEFIQNSNLTDYSKWLNHTKGLSFKSYDELWGWSVNELNEFWKSIWEYFNVGEEIPGKILSDDPMPSTKWFEGETLNYGEHLVRAKSDQRPAIIFRNDKQESREVSWAEIEKEAGALRSFLKKNKISKGDRVVAFLTNIPEANISFLATTSLGAIWSSCSPDFGTGAVIDRFQQIEPKVLIAVDGYNYGGKYFDKRDVLNEIIKAIPSLEIVIIQQTKDNRLSEHDYLSEYDWAEIQAQESGPLTFEKVPFDHPLWVLYSSGTTGIPKAITHCHGGILLEHYKYLSLHSNIKPGDKCFWFTTTGWMMWNYIQASWLCGGVIIQYEGSPAYPDLNALWKFTEDVGINHFGTSAGFIVANMKNKIHPGKDFDLSSLKSIGSTGSPLPPDGFDWIYNEIKSDLWLASVSGGTDVCSVFVGGNPWLPVYSGEIQSKSLGCNLYAFNENGESVTNEVGEMVVTSPMPCMPIYFWNDKDNSRYFDSYFNMFPNIWRHGDWIKIQENGGIIIYGRSDSTLNRDGIRIGTAEIYRAMDKIEQVVDSLIICLEKENGDFYMPLFVQLKKSKKLDPKLINKINNTIRSDYTPRHVPDEIIQIEQIPYTISGKKVETPVKKILMGYALEKTINPDALKNPASLNQFVELREKMK